MNNKNKPELQFITELFFIEIIKGKCLSHTWATYSCQVDPPRCHVWQHTWKSVKRSCGKIMSSEKVEKTNRRGGMWQEWGGGSCDWHCLTPPTTPSLPLSLGWACLEYPPSGLLNPMPRKWIRISVGFTFDDQEKREKQKQDALEGCYPVKPMRWHFSGVRSICVVTFPPMKSSKSS